MEKPFRFQVTALGTTHLGSVIAYGLTELGGIRPGGSVEVDRPGGATAVCWKTRRFDHAEKLDPATIGLVLWTSGDDAVLVGDRLVGDRLVGDLTTATGRST